MTSFPIFLFSLPRAGSTLLQRILTSHRKIGATAEPWILLPFVYATRPSGVFSEYSHEQSQMAVADFIETLPNGESSFFSNLGEFVCNLYQGQLRNNESYFLDKTPRYYLIIPEIEKMFPKAKFVFLFRNPLAVMASVIETWNRGTLRFYNNYIDLYLGPKRLAEGYDLLQEKSASIQYEALVADPETEVKRLCEYLEIDFDSSVLTDFSTVSLHGRMGDKTGKAKYKHIERASLDKWKTTFNSKRRIRYAESYLDFLGDDILSVHGYMHDDLKRQLSELHPKKSGLITDNLSLLQGFIARNTEIGQIKTRIKSLRNQSGMSHFLHS